MDIGLLFWFLMILWALSLIPWDRDNPWLLNSGRVLQWILFALLGWKAFGPILH